MKTKRSEYIHASTHSIYLLPLLRKGEKKAAFFGGSNFKRKQWYFLYVMKGNLLYANIDLLHLIFRCLHLF